MRLARFALVAALFSCARGTTQQLPAAIAYTAIENGVPRIWVGSEVAGWAPVAISPAGQRASFVGALGLTPKDATPNASRDLQIVYGIQGDDAGLLSLRKAGIDGKTDVPLADLPASTWTSPAGAWQTTDGTIVVQLSHLDGSGPALLAVRNGAASQLAAGRFLAIAGNRIAYLSNAPGAADIGDVRSVASDGSANLALGGGGGDDQLHGVKGSLLVFTALHSGTKPELRFVGVDGVSQMARAGSRGLVFSSENSAVIAERSGAYEKIGLDLHVSAVSLLGGAQVLALLSDGRVASFVKGAGVMVDNKVIDSWAAESVLGAHQFADRLVYTINNAAGSYLRSARVDGSLSTGLSEGHGQQLLFTAELPGDRVLFYRTKTAEPGGWLSTVSLTGGAEKLIGDDITGTRKAADQDYGGMTRTGRLVFEAELKEGSGPSLFLVDTSGEVRPLTPSGINSTLAAILE